MGQSLENWKHRLRDVLESSTEHSSPFAYWELHDALPDRVCDLLGNYTPSKSNIAFDTRGERATHNPYRIFLDEAARKHSKVLNKFAKNLDSAETRRAFENTCGVSLENTMLRVELCCDGEGFWLKPHRDIGAKKLTLIIPLSRGSKSKDWGTDLLNEDGRIVARASGDFNSGLLFIPGEDTWHGFSPRPIHGIRRTLIINYVSNDWKARHELAFSGRMGH